MNLKAVATIAAKDLIDAIRNYRLLAVVLMPIGFSVLYSFLFRDTPSSSQIVVYDPGGSHIVESIEALDGWTMIPVSTEADIQTTLSEKNALAGVSLPADFDARLAAGERPPLKIVLNGSQSGRLGARRLVIDLVLSQSGQPLPIDLSETIIHQEAAERQTSAPLFSGLSLQGAFLVIWSMFGIAMVGVYMVPTLLVEEKERKTLDAVLVAPVSYVDLIVGKALVGMVYALLSAGLVFVLNPATKVHSVGALIGVGAVSALFTTLFGLWLGGLISNTQSLNAWSSFILLPFILPGILAGLPNNPLGGILQFFPATHTLEGISRALSGESLDRIWVNVLVLTVGCALASVLVWLSLRQRERA